MTSYSIVAPLIWLTIANCQVFGATHYCAPHIQFAVDHRLFGAGSTKIGCKRLLQSEGGGGKGVTRKDLF